MRRFALAFLFASIFIFSGCSPNPIKVDSVKKERSPPSTENSKDSSVVTAPVDYIATTIKVGEQSKGTIDLAAIRKAIEYYEVSEGQKPSSLDDLVQKKYIPSIPPPRMGKKVAYDPVTGTVSLISEDQ